MLPSLVTASEEFIPPMFLENCRSEKNWLFLTVGTFDWGLLKTSSALEVALVVLGCNRVMVAGFFLLTAENIRFGRRTVACS